MDHLQIHVKSGNLLIKVKPKLALRSTVNDENYKAVIHNNLIMLRKDHEAIIY